MCVRRAITLVEMLVVIATIAVLAAILLPAVQAAREAGRRLQCSSNLRQLGLAAQHFESNRGFLPPAQLWAEYPNQPQTLAVLGVSPGTAHSWFIFLAPFAEQTNVAQLYDRRFDSRSSQNRAARETFVPLLQCPSSAERSPLDKIYAHPQFGDLSGGINDYAVCCRLDAALAPDVNRSWSLLAARSTSTLAEATDGLSNTMLIGEDAAKQAHYVTGRRRVPGHPVSMWSQGVSSFALIGHQRDGLSSPGPCPMNCSNSSGFYAFHPGGMNAVFGDGSVRFVAETSDLKVIAALVTRAAQD